MQFIDQSAAYSKKSISLADAVAVGRAKMELQPGADKLALCLRPELGVANAFDAGINERLRFFDLTTPEKLDLMIDELLPGFFHANLLPLTGAESWSVHFVVDGDVHRTLIMDADGIRATEPGPDDIPAFELETDIMTLLAILRATIADFHLNAPDFPPAGIAELSPDEAAAISGGTPPGPGDEGDEDDEGDEGDENDEGNEDDEGNESDEGDEGNENDEQDEGDEGNEGDEGPAARDDGSRGGYACGPDGGSDEDACGADACAVDAGSASDGSVSDPFGADLAGGLDIDLIDPGA